MSEDKPKRFFDEEKKKKALEELSKKWTGKKECEICGTNNWSVPDDIVMPMAFTGGGLTIGGPTYPQLQIICSNCGNTKIFNAVILGIAPKGGEDGK